MESYASVEFCLSQVASGAVAQGLGAGLAATAAVGALTSMFAAFACSCHLAIS